MTRSPVRWISLVFFRKTSSPKKTKKAFKCRKGEKRKKEKKLEYLSFKYRKFQVTRKNSIEMKVVPTVSWYSESSFWASFMPAQWPWVVGNCEQTSPPLPAMACFIFPPFTPDARLLHGPSGSHSSPRTSHPTVATCPTCNPSFSGIPGCPGGEAQPPALSRSPATRPARPLPGARRTPQSSSLAEVYDDSFPQQPLNGLVCSCLLLSSNC